MTGLKRTLVGGVAAAAAAIVISGCGATSAVATNGDYWLVKVRDGYANVYLYPVGDKPGTSHAVELGKAKSLPGLAAAARQLGVPRSNVTNASA